MFASSQDIDFLARHTLQASCCAGRHQLLTIVHVTVGSARASLGLDIFIVTVAPSSIVFLYQASWQNFSELIITVPQQRT